MTYLDKRMGKDEIKNRIRDKLVDLARVLGNDAAGIGDDEIIPATGLLDSAGILELVVWYEGAFDMPLQQEEINIDNLGSIELMAEYVLKRKRI
jgi:D-alanine--poly(phosphoribitol) ligase subunit 2